MGCIFFCTLSIYSLAFLRFSLSLSKPIKISSFWRVLHISLACQPSPRVASTTMCFFVSGFMKMFITDSRRTGSCKVDGKIRKIETKNWIKCSLFFQIVKRKPLFLYRIFSQENRINSQLFYIFLIF